MRSLGRVRSRISVATAEIVLRRWIARSWSRSKTPSGKLSFRPRVSPPVATRRVRALGFASVGVPPLPCSAPAWSSAGSLVGGSGCAGDVVGRISVDANCGIPR